MSRKSKIIVPIYTARLILRHFIPSDYELLRELDSDPAVLRYRSRTYMSPDMTREFLHQAQQSVQDDPREFYAYAIVRADTGEWLGQCGLTVLVANTSAFVWYSLLPKYWGQGYMTEAVQALSYAGATEFKLDQIFAECHPENQASIRVMQKAGLQYQGNIQITNLAGKIEERVRYGLAGRELERLNGKNIRIEHFYKRA
jgi:ribosomal-protein-alanine N-acetyltransferase